MRDDLARKGALAGPVKISNDMSGGVMRSRFSGMLKKSHASWMLKATTVPFQSVQFHTTTTECINLLFFAPKKAK